MNRDENRPPETTDETEGVGRGIDRRNFLGGVGGLTLGTLSGGLTGLAALSHPARAAETAAAAPPLTGAKRAEAAYKVRVDAAERERRLPIPQHLTNGDEERYPTRIGSFSKSL